MPKNKRETLILSTFMSICNRKILFPFTSKNLKNILTSSLTLSSSLLFLYAKPNTYKMVEKLFKLTIKKIIFIIDIKIFQMGGAIC